MCRVDLDSSSGVSKASSDLLQYIQNHVSDATLTRTRAQERTFTLPLTSAHKFPGNSFALSTHALLLLSKCIHLTSTRGVQKVLQVDMLD